MRYEIKVKVLVIIFVVLLTIIGIISIARSQSKAPFNIRSVSIGRAYDGYQGLGFGGGGGSAPMLGGGLGVVAGPWINMYSGGLSESNITDSGMIAYGQATGAKIVWTSSVADSGHVRWDETGNTTWNYEEEAGDDSVQHYVVTTGWTVDYTGYDWSIRTGKASGVYSDWSATFTVYTDCQGVSTYSAEAALWNVATNELRITPDYKGKVQFRYMVTLPTPGEWQSDDIWRGDYNTTIKSCDIGVLAASSTYDWEYRIETPCLVISGWQAVAGTFTTDADGHIN